jgi:hypothetical protein
MNTTNIPGPGDVATWSGLPAGWNGDNPWLQQARDHLLACPDDWALWMAECNDWPGEGVAANVDYVGEDMSLVNTITLFAVVLAGTSEQCLRARYELRQRFLRAHAQRIDDLAEQILRDEADAFESRFAGEEY